MDHGCVLSLSTLSPQVQDAHLSTPSGKISHSHSAALSNIAVIAWHLLVRRRKCQRKSWRMEVHKTEEHLEDRRGTPSRRYDFAGACRNLTCWPWSLKMFRRAVSLITMRFKKSFGQFNFLECFFFLCSAFMFKEAKLNHFCKNRISMASECWGSAIILLFCLSSVKALVCAVGLHVLHYFSHPL